MTNKELIHYIYEHSGLPKKDIVKVLMYQREAIEVVLPRGGLVALSGIGTFAPDRRAARFGRNPRTGDRIRISQKKIVKFTAAATLAALVKG